MPSKQKSLVFAGITGAAVLGMLLSTRFDIPASYHDFADKRGWLGIPNFGDVASNLGFLIAGLYGIGVTLRKKGEFEDAREVAPYLVLFVGITLTAFGSSYYHLAPDDARLFWDRLPMTVGFMGLFAAIIAERVSVKAGSGLLVPLVVCGAASLVYWYWSVEHGVRDLRPYALVQAYPLVAILLLLAMFPARYSRGGDFLVAVGWYAAAKVFESADKAIFSASGHVVSGHTLKHLAAGAGGYWLARMLALRVRVSSPAARAVSHSGR